MNDTIAGDVTLMKNRLDTIEDEIKKKLALRNKIRNTEVKPFNISEDTEIRPLDVKLEPLEIELSPLDVKLEAFEDVDTTDLFKDLEFNGFEDIELEPFKDLEFNGFEDLEFNGFEDIDTSNLFEDLELRPLDELFRELDLPFNSIEERDKYLAELEAKIKKLLEERDKLKKEEAGDK